MKLRIIVLGLLVFIGIFIAHRIYTSDAFQKAIFPAKYWKEQIQYCKESIEFHRLMLKDTERDLQRLEQDRELEIRLRRPIGIKEPDATRYAIEDYNKAREDARKQKEYCIDTVWAFRNDLVIAERNLDASVRASRNLPAPAKEEAKPTPPRDADTQQEKWPGTRWEDRTIANSDVPLSDHQKAYEEKNGCRLTRLDDGTVLCISQ